jgi:hypothetical protein
MALMTERIGGQALDTYFDIYLLYQINPRAGTEGK